MKKILLMLALMLPCLGAWAQNATTHADGVYKIFWQWNSRGYLTYHADYPNDPQLAGVELDGHENKHYQLTDEGIQLFWYLYTSPNTGKTYLFETTTGKFITIDLTTTVGNGKKCILSTEVTTEAQLDLKATTNTEGYMLSYKNYNLCSGCGSLKGENPVRFATDGQTDGGVPFVFVSEGTINDEVKNVAIDKINTFEKEIVWTEALNILDCFKPFLDWNHEYWGFASEEDRLVFSALSNAPENSDITDLKNLIAECRSFKLPVPKKFFRIKAVDGWNDDAPYLGANNSTAKSGRAEFVANKDQSSIFYGNGNSLISYGSGNYLVSNSDYLGYDGVQENGLTVAFRLASNGLTDAYNIGFKDCSRWLYVNQNNYTDAGNNANNAPSNTNGYCFYLEEVTEIPVTISAAKYASFYTPVTMTVPEDEDIKAYCIKSSKVVGNETWANLEEIEGGVIPAGTGVILHSETPDTYYLTVGGKATAIEGNWLTGTAASAYIDVESYVLSNKSGIGLYIAELDQVNNTKWLNNGFKAYLPVESVTGPTSNVLRFTFGGNTTAIESVLNNGTDANAPIYDLTGRRVMNTVKGGIYIQNGKKFIVK